MLGKVAPPSLIQTKLNQPPLPVDMVHRPRLTSWLTERQGRPLTLISAPAGYGKSTLISSWLSSLETPSAWISIDKQDNQLGGFLGYFLAAIQTIFPDAVPETRAFLTTTPQPSVPAITHTLINELNQIEQPYILVLDDYHLIESQVIHEFLNELLIHPPRNLHLVLGTRMDPPLPLVTLRANGQMSEIRIQGLRFTREETSQLFQNMIEGAPNGDALESVDTQAEGWVTGLRLAALAMRHRIGTDNIQGKLSIQNRYVTEYLVSEILAKQSAALSNFMLQTSILERFNVELCEAIHDQAVLLRGEESAQPALNGEQSLEWLQASNLFLIPLDDQNEWFRYHHLFRDFLQQELVNRYNRDEINGLHAAAGRWFAQNGWLEEALSHFMTADHPDAAIEVIKAHRYDMMNATQWPRLERWLSSFSATVIDTSPELCMLQTWLIYHRGQWSDVPAALEHLGTLLDGSEPGTAKRLEGEISSLRGLTAYQAGNTEEVVLNSSRALELTPPELWIVRVFARMYLGAGLLLKGDARGGYHAFYDGFDEEQIQPLEFKATLLMTTCYFHWMTADLQGMVQSAERAIALCLEADFRQILGQSRYHLGCVRYQQNELIEAEGLFSWVFERPYQNYGTCYTASVCGLAVTLQGLGKETEARQAVEDSIAFLLETGNMNLLPSILALQAEIALRQGDLPAASQWAAKLDPVPPLAPMPWFFAPHLTLVKVWLAQKTPSSMKLAGDLLDQIQVYLEGIHNTRFLIDTLALQSLLAQSIGEPTRARSALEKALRLAQPGKFMRVFADLGAPMRDLLSQMQVEDLQDTIDQILSTFPRSRPMRATVRHGELLDPLTNRELEVLELLGRRLTNKEIAAELVISPGTVKGHTIKIYHKLDVSNRLQAIEKAKALGILAA